MSDLVNYVYIPFWMLLVLAGMSFIGFEFLVHQVVRWLERITRPRVKQVPGKAEIVLLQAKEKVAR